jgi:hypothetical protein
MKNFFRRSTQPSASTPVASAPEALADFESILVACKATGDYTPAWERFANTYFFVRVNTNDNGAKTSDFRFHIFQNRQDGKPYISISEHMQNFSVTEEQKAIREVGGKLVAMLNPEVGIAVALSNKGAFCMPPDLVGWLRASIQGVKP